MCAWKEEERDGKKREVCGREESGRGRKCCVHGKKDRGQGRKNESEKMQLIHYNSLGYGGRVRKKIKVKGRETAVHLTNSPYLPISSAWAPW